MIPERIVALFEFIDFLDAHKKEYIEKYIPLCHELIELDTQKSLLKPRENYLDKLKYDAIQKNISEKFQPIQQDIYIPFTSKLRDLKIWSGDDIYTSIFNNNSAAIFDFRENFEPNDIETVLAYKHKYLSFRRETNNSFLCLQFVLNNLDEIYKYLFDFFKDSSENEFESFEAKILELDSLNDVASALTTNKATNFAYAIPPDSFLNYQNLRKPHPKLYLGTSIINNEFIMGNKIQLGDINGHGNVLNSGNEVNIHAKIKISKGDLEKLKHELTNSGIEEEDIQELSEILQSEEPGAVHSPLSEKSNQWILKIAGKALSGTGKIATGVSSNLLAGLIRQYYGI